jgi:hypothetical protein
MYEKNEGVVSDSIRGRIALLERGEWPHGKVPYGYDSLYIDPSGHEKRVKRNESHRKGHRWRRLLDKNQEEAKVVEWRLVSDQDNRSGSDKFLINFTDTRPRSWIRERDRSRDPPTESAVC